MNRMILVICLTFAFLLTTTYTQGQKATELYIPIGQSPGISGKYSIIGDIESVDVQTGVISLKDPSGTHRTAVDRTTVIYLDRSHLGQKNQYGAFSDLQPGLLIEVKYQEEALRGEGAAEWIKVQITE